MRYEISLNTGMKFTLDAEFETEAFVQSINESNVQFFSLGNLILNKHEVFYMKPIDEVSEAPEYKVIIRGGQVLKAYDADFNAGELVAKLNNRENTLVAIGNTIVHSQQISVVVPA